MARFPHTRDQVRNAKTQLILSLPEMDGITSVGIGLTEARDDYAVVVTVQSESHKRRVPEIIDGVPVRVAVSGPITALR